MANKLITKVIKSIPQLTDKEIVMLTILLERELIARMNREKETEFENKRKEKG